MKHRVPAGMNAAFFSWRIARSTAVRVRQSRPCLECLESRKLLATVAEFAVPSGTIAAPSGIATARDGSVWFTEFGANKIGMVNPSTLAISEFPIPTPNSQPFRIALGPDGNLWFTEFGANQIGMIDPAATDTIREFTIPTSGAQPFDITAGPNNTIWFTEWAGNQIGMIDIATGFVTEYKIPTLNSVPEGITLGSDGNIWFTESAGNKIAMLDVASKNIYEHPLKTPGAQPYGITSGPGGNIWFTEYSGNQIGMLDLTGSSGPVEYKIATPNTQPTEIAVGPDGNLWFTQSQANQVAIFNPSTQMVTEEIKSLSPLAGPRGITAGKDGGVWFTGLNAGMIGRIAPSTRFVVTSLPSFNANPGAAFGFTISVEFDSGAVDTSYQGSVTVACTSSPGGSIAGTTTVMAKDGVAVFSGLSLIATGSYTLQVSAVGDTTPATIGPIVVTALPGSSPGSAPSAPILIGQRLVMAGKGKNRYVSAIVLTFSTPLAAGTAQDPANYIVVQATRGSRARAVQAIRLRPVYKPSTNIVWLTFAGRPRFAAGGQLVVNGANPSGIASLHGVRLQGNRGGYPGTNSILTILPKGRGIAN